MPADDASFQLMTALVYRAGSSDERFPLLSRHFARLKAAHAAFQQEEPSSWCSRVAMPSDDQMLVALHAAVQAAQREGNEGDLRVRIPSPTLCDVAVATRCEG